MRRALIGGSVWRTGIDLYFYLFFDLQRCVQAHYPRWTDWLAFTVCINGDCGADADGCKNEDKVGGPGNAAAEKACAEKQGFDWAAIEACEAGKEGVQLMQADADHDNAVGEVYGMQGLPVVHVGGSRVSVSKFWDCNSNSTDYQAKLIAAICNATAPPKPPVCAKAP